MRAIKAVVTGKQGGVITLEMENGLTCQFTTKKCVRLLQKMSVIYDPGKMEIVEVLSEQECMDLDKVQDCAGHPEEGAAAEVIENLEVWVLP
jgi:hypothetical protein